MNLPEPSAKKGQMCHKTVIYKSLGPPDPTHRHLSQLSKEIFRFLLLGTFKYTTLFIDVGQIFTSYSYSRAGLERCSLLAGWKESVFNLVALSMSSFSLIFSKNCPPYSKLPPPPWDEDSSIVLPVLPQQFFFQERRSGEK